MGSGGRHGGYIGPETGSKGDGVFSRFFTSPNSWKGLEGGDDFKSAYLDLPEA